MATNNPDFCPFSDDGLHAWEAIGASWGAKYGRCKVCGAHRLVAINPPQIVGAA